MTAAGTAPATPSRSTPTMLTAAAWASIGSGVIHAAAADAHTDYRSAALAFTVVAAFQVLWGVSALAAPNRVVTLVGAVGSAGLVGAWLLAKTAGIDSIEGLEVAAPAGVADTAAAVLAAGSSGLALSVAMADLRRRRPRSLGRSAAAAAAIGVVGLVLASLVTAPAHDHGDRRVDAHAHEHDGGAGADREHTLDHAHRQIPAP